MKKKLRSLLWAFTACVTAFSSSLYVCADDDTACLELGGAYAAENDIVYINADLSGDVNAAAYSVTLEFDPSLLEFVSASCGFEGGTFYYKSLSDDSARMVWSSKEDKELSDTLFTAVFKTRSETSGSEIAVDLGYCVIGNDDMNEVDFEKQGCLIKVLKDYKWGDANCDGSTNSADAVALVKMSIDREENPLSDAGLLNCDTDNNGIINEKDVDTVNEHVLTY